jgi:hypothetical protein
MNQIDIDFLEIGTSDVDSIIQTCDDNSIGFSVEPLKYYLDKLPNKENVKKINKAITGDKNHKGKIKIYYIPFDTIIKENLPLYLRGCNKVEDYHPLHINLNIQHLVKIENVKLINIGDFLIENNIRGIKYLKIDTEGYDFNILKGLYDYLCNLSPTYYPLEILFETNTNGDKYINDLYDIFQLYYNLGYIIVESIIIPNQCTNTLLIKI